MKTHPIPDVNAGNAKSANVYDIPILIIKEDHLRERNSGLVVQPLKVCDFAAWVDFPLNKVFAKVKELQELVGPLYLTCPRSSGDRHAKAGK